MSEVSWLIQCHTEVSSEAVNKGRLPGNGQKIGGWGGGHQVGRGLEELVVSSFRASQGPVTWRANGASWAPALSHLPVCPPGWAKPRTPRKGVDPGPANVTTGVVQTWTGESF